MKMCESVSAEAEEMILKLNQALEMKELNALGELLFDCECEGFDSEIDLKWYQAKVIEGDESQWFTVNILN